MRRDLQGLTDSTFDLIVVGGGISGAFVAWDGALRGLRVALLEKEDFGHATSAASGRVIHGGLRHLQRGAIGLLRESFREQQTLARIAPHLVRPLPFLVPSYGHLSRGRVPLAAALLVHRAVTSLDRRAKRSGPDRRAFDVLSREGALRLAPALATEGLTGAVLYDEMQAENAERLTLAVVQAAADAGAVVANYVEATDVLRSGDDIEGVSAVNGLSGELFDVRGRVVVNLAGPWAPDLCASLGSPVRPLEVTFSKGVHIVTRQLVPGVALALLSRQRWSAARASRGGRHIFIMPWRGHSLIGATNTPYDGRPDRLRPDQADIDGLLEEVGRLYPAGGLRPESVLYAFAGLYPIFERGGGGRNAARGVAVRSRIRDHDARDGIRGMITGIAVKYTTARSFAERVVGLACRKLGRVMPPGRTSATSVKGGDIEDLDAFLTHATRGRPNGLSAADVRRLIGAYGTEWMRLQGYAQQDPEWFRPLDRDRTALRVEVVHAVREEMALKLADVVLRRTALGQLGHPGRGCLREVAGIMAAELDWDGDRVSRELDEVDRHLSTHTGLRGPTEANASPGLPRAEAKRRSGRR